MKLVMFFLRMRMRAYFTIDNWKIILLNAGLLLLVLFYAFIVWLLLDKIQQGSLSITKEKIISTLNFSVFLLPFLVKVFPSFAYKKPVFSNHYPISKINIAILDLLVFNFLRPIVLILCFCLLVLHVASSTFDTELTVYSLLFLISGFLFAENIVTSISWNRVGVSLVSVVVVIPLVIFNFSKPGLFLSGMLMLTIMLQLILQFLLYTKQTDRGEGSPRTRPESAKPVTKNTFLFQKISLRKPAFRTTVLIAFIVKLFILFFYVPGIKDAQFAYVNNPVFFLVFAPSFLFTYIFNNAWGYFRALTFNMIIAGDGMKTFARAYAKLLLVYIMADFLVSITAMLIFGFFSFRLILAYLLCTFFSFALGLTGSFYRFFEVKTAMSLSSFKPNTSPLINILTILPAILFFFLNKNIPGFTMIMFFFTLAGLILLLFLQKNEKRILEKFNTKIISGQG